MLKILEEITGYIKLSNFDCAVACFVSNINTLFSEPNLNLVYDTVIKIPKTYFKTHNQKILYGWLCFANGNYSNLRWVLSTVDSKKLLDDIYKASYLALYSMTLSSSDPVKGLEMVKNSLTYISNDDTSVLKANVYMSYGRQLANLSQYSLAAYNFSIAGKIFEKNNCLFLAISCYSNEVLSYFALGEHTELIKKCSYYLKMSTSFDENNPTMWNILKLPLAMSYYVLNKRSISLKLLDDVKQAIDSSHLPHLHGLPELYLFKTYSIEENESEIERLISSLDNNFKNLNYASINYLITSMKIERCILFNHKIRKDYVEQLELLVDIQKEKTHFFVIETLLKLKLKERHTKLSLDFLENYFEHLQQIGHMENIQSCALYLTEFYFSNKLKDKAKYYLQIAYDIYLNTKTSINFFNRSISFISMISDLDFKLADEIKKQNSFLHKDEMHSLVEPLTKRELEILEVMSKGKSNKKIAEYLFISEGTVKWHLANIYSKLGVKNRVEALDKVKRCNISI